MDLATDQLVVRASHGNRWWRFAFLPGADMRYLLTHGLPSVVQRLNKSTLAPESFLALGQWSEGWAFTEPAQVLVAAVEPNTCGQNGGISATVRGAAFHGEIRDESGNVVQQRTRGFFGWVEATIVTLVDSTQLRVAVPVHAPGTVDVVVQNPNGRSATLPGGFTYSAETSAPRTPRSREPGVSNSPTRPRTRPTTRLPLHLSSGWRFVRGEAPAAEVASVRRFQRIAPGRRRLHPGER